MHTDNVCIYLLFTNDGSLLVVQKGLPWCRMLLWIMSFVSMMCDLCGKVTNKS